MTGSAFRSVPAASRFSFSLFGEQKIPTCHPGRVYWEKKKNDMADLKSFVCKNVFGMLLRTKEDILGKERNTNKKAMVPQGVWEGGKADLKHCGGSSGRLCL